MTDNEKFLAAWEVAGKPPVKKLVYPQFGRGRDEVFFAHTEIEMWAKTEGARYADNGEDVKLWWTYPGNLTDSGGTTELYFDRANPIHVGRTPNA